MHWHVPSSLYGSSDSSPNTVMAASGMVSSREPSTRALGLEEEGWKRLRDRDCAEGQDRDSFLKHKHCCNVAGNVSSYGALTLQHCNCYTFVAGLTVCLHR